MAESLSRPGDETGGTLDHTMKEDGFSALVRTQPAGCKSSLSADGRSYRHGARTDLQSRATSSQRRGTRLVYFGGIKQGVIFVVSSRISDHNNNAKDQGRMISSKKPDVESKVKVRSRIRSASWASAGCRSDWSSPGSKEN